MSSSCSGARDTWRAKDSIRESVDHGERGKAARMWVSWMVARQLVVGLVLVALALVGLELAPFLRTMLFLD